MRRISASIIVLAAAVLIAGAAIAGESILGAISLVLGMFLFIGGFVDLVRADKGPD